MKIITYNVNAEHPFCAITTKTGWHGCRLTDADVVWLQ